MKYMTSCFTHHFRIVALVVMCLIFTHTQVYSFTDAKLWLRADAGVSLNGTRVQTWADQSVNGNTLNQADWNYQPEYIATMLNGNPVLEFWTGSYSSAAGRYSNLMRYNLLGGQSYSYVSSFAVMSVDNGPVGNGTNNGLYYEGAGSLTMSSNFNWGNNSQFNPGQGNGSIGFALPTTLSDSTTSQSVYRDPQILSHVFNSTAVGGEGFSISLNGRVLGTSALGSTAQSYEPWNASNRGTFSLGGVSQTGGPIRGYLAEVLLFTTQITPARKNQVESYLAIKYGRPLSQVSATNYTNTSGSVVWNASTNTSYNTDIIGVGRDLGSSLNRTQSELYSGASIRLNTSTTLSDKQYLLMGHNNGSLSWTTNGLGSMDLFNRRWLIQKTGPTTAYTTSVSFPSSIVAAGTSGYIILDNDTDLNNGITSYVPLTLVSDRYVASGIDFPVGSTYISVVRGPISTNIGDRVWIDTNANGLQDAGEAGLGSVTVKIYSCGPYAATTQPPINYVGGLIGTTTTNAAGTYNFAVVPGTYYLEFTVPSSYKFTAQHVGGYGVNTTTNSDVSPLSAKTRCESYNFGTTDTSVDAGVITQVYSSCDSLTLSNVANVGGSLYQKAGVSFTANLVGYGQNASIAGTNVSGIGSNNGSWRAITWSPTLSSSTIGAVTINASVDGMTSKLEYYNNPSIQSLTCPYRTVSTNVFCAESAPLAPYKTSSLNMNEAPTTPAPISYCTAGQSSLPCTAAIDRPQSAIVTTPNTCSQTITILDEYGICNNVVTDVPAADCRALVDFYNSTAGASWTIKTNWMFNADSSWNTVCDWYGITCTSGRVSQINLSSNNIGGTLPLSLSALTALSTINLGTNPIGGTLPTSWSNLVNMQYFTIAGTNIGGSLPSEYSTWSNLRALACMGTRLVGQLPASWSTMTQLNSVHCPWPQGGYGFTGTLPASWSTMTALRSLYLEANSIGGQIPSSLLTAWSSINNLSLYGNNFDGPLPTELTTYPSLSINGWNSTFGGNCFGTGHLNVSQQSFFDTYASAGPSTSWADPNKNWKVQKTCSTDIAITSATITQGDLVNGGSATYSVTVTNNGSRWAYNPKVTVTLNGGLTTTTPVLTYGTLAPGASQTLTLITTKGSVSVGTNNITNTFTLADISITDSNTANNTVNNVVSVRGSAYSVCNSSLLTVTVGDCEALGDLYTSTNGANWTNKTNWLTSPDVGTWFGVIVSNGRVYSLSLGKNNTAGNAYRCDGNCGNNLSGSLPSTIGNLTELTILFLNTNNITGPLPASFWTLSKLHDFVAYSTKISGTIPASVSGLTSMSYFQLNSTSLSGQLPSQLFSLPNINYIILSSNNLNSSIPTLTYNPSLVYIDLNNAGIVGNPFNELVKMTNLSQLHISGNPLIGGTLPSTINNLTKLTNLNISNDGLSGLFPNITIPTLLYLQLNTNAFTGSLPSLPNSIMNLEAADNSFNGSLLSSYGLLPNFQILYLWNNNLSGPIPSTWSNLTKIIALGLGNNNFEGVMPVTLLQSMSALTNNWNTMIGTNCFYTGGLSTGDITFLDSKFSYYNTNNLRAWRNQKICGTDLELVSATTTGTLDGNATLSYLISYRNNGPRTAYDPRITITLSNGLQFSDSSASVKTISLGQLAVGATGTITVTINKLGVGSATINYSNSFMIADTSVSDTNSTNNTKTLTGVAKGSQYSVCLNTALNISQSDCEALGDLYTSTNGANWTNKTNWLTSPDVSTWWGVTVANGRVTSLCLNANGSTALCNFNGTTNNLSGSLPSSIGNLTELNKLIISNNKISGSLPSSIGNLTKVQYLYFNDNQISGPIPSTIESMSGVINLYGWSNQLSSSIPSQIANMSTISTIDLRYNQLSGPVPDLSAANDTLRILNLDNNNLTGGLSWLPVMTNLAQLRIGYNPLGGTIPSTICNLTALTTMGLYGNQLVGTIPTCIWSMTPLVQLSLYSNDFTGSLDGLTFNLPNIYYFQLGHNPNMRGSLPSSIGSITNVRELYLPNMGLVGSLPSSLANLTLANRFDVQYNYLDRDSSNNAILSGAIGTWYTNMIEAYPGYKNISSQGDIIHPLLGGNAKRLPILPSFNYPDKSIMKTVIAGPNTTKVEAVLLGGSPTHVGYDVGSFAYYSFQNGKTYTFSFWARTLSGTRNINPTLTDNTNEGPIEQIHAIDTTWKLVSVTKTYTNVGANPRAFFNISQQGGDFYVYDPIVTESTNMPSSLDTNSIMYPLVTSDSSDWDSAGRVVSAGGGGLCSNLTVTPNKNRDQGLALYYNFDDNTAKDSSLNGINGSLTNNPGFIDGKGGLGKAINFDGTAKNITVPNTNLPKGTSDFTYSWWTKWNATPSTNTASYFENGTRGSSLIIRQENANAVMIFAMGTQPGGFTFSPVVGQWYHLSVVRSGNTMYFYVNGTQVGSVAFNVNLAPTANLFIGSSQYTPGQNINAAMDDIRIYNRALSATEVAQMYNTTITIAAPGTYNSCYLTVTDRAGNSSNAVRLGDFTATFSPYPICNDPARTVPQSECTALMDLYTSAGGSGWTNKTNWGTSPDIDSWFGVTTTVIGGKQYVSQVCLSHSTEALSCGASWDGTLGNNLSGSLSSSVGSLPYLQKLILNNNKLSGPIPTTIGNLKNLTMFHAMVNRLSGTIPTEIGGATALNDLSLAVNQLVGPIPSSLSTTNLSILRLWDNQLVGPIPNLSALNWTNFEIGANNIADVLPDWIGNEVNITHLYLRGNQFYGTFPASWANMTKLVHLYLDVNQISGPIPTWFGNMTGLATFMVNGNRLDRDLNNSAIIPSVLSGRYNGITNKNITSQSDTIAPVITGNPLTGSYSFDTMSYSITMNEASVIATGGQAVIVGGGGTCSQISAIGSLYSGNNVIILKFATGSSATTVYTNCTLTTTDRASNISNAINLGTFSVKLNPYPICNSLSLTVPQSQCVALMDLYTNLGGNSWTTKTNWGTNPDIGSWYGLVTVNSLLARYTFDDTLSDSSTNNITATNSGGATFVPGMFGSALNFDGSSKRVIVDNTLLKHGTSDFTYSWWTKWNATPSTNTASYFENGTRGNSLIIRQENATTINFYAMSAYLGSLPFTPTVGQWYHLSVVRSNNQLYLYVNGLLAGSLAFNINLVPTANLFIGSSQYTPGQNINAAMDDIRIYNRALSLTEITQLYQTNTMGPNTVTSFGISNPNNIAGTFPNIFDNLLSLTSLVIENNPGVIGSIPSTISTLPRLATLILNGLGISGTLPATLPLSLSNISISENTSLTAAPLPSSWSSLTNLTSLSVQNINANGSLPTSRSALTKLQALHLARNNFNSQVPTSWMTALTGVRYMAWDSANLDGPLPPEFANWNIDTSFAWNLLQNNCFGTGHLTAAQISALDTKFTRTKWATQKACTTDLGLTVSQTGSVDTNGNALMYTVTVTNNGTRWAYSPRVAVVLGGGLRMGGMTTGTMVYDTLAPGASQTQTLSVIKSSTSPTTLTNITNTFTVSDITIIDSNAANNTVNDTEPVKASTNAICNHYALNTSIAECDALVDLHASTNGGGWTQCAVQGGTCSFAGTKQVRYGVLGAYNYGTYTSSVFCSNGVFGDPLVGAFSKGCDYYTTGWNNGSNWKELPNIASWYGITPSVSNALVAHYTFDNTLVGESYLPRIQDDANNTYPGIMMNNVLITGGRYGNAAQFNGANRINLGTSLNPGTTITISTWVYRASTASSQGIVWKNGVYGFAYRNNTLQVAPGNSWTWYDTNITVPLNQWTHLTWTYDGSTMRAYRNGVLLWSYALAGSLPSNGNITYIGYDENGWRRNGAIDDTRIYNRALTADEVTKLYTFGTIGTIGVAQLKLGDGATYSSGGGNNLSGVLPSTLGGLSNLNLLWINGNPNLTGTVPSNFWNLTKLTDIRAMYTSLGGSLPSFGSSFGALKKVLLSHTRFSGELPNSWGQNTLLSTIWLGANQFTSEKITGNLPSSRGGLSNLTEFAVYYAGLTGTIPSSFGGLNQMWNFQIQGNQLSGPIPSTLSSWAGPFAFFIDGNQFVGDTSFMNTWNTGSFQYLGMQNNNFDRDPNNNAYLPAWLMTKGPTLVSYGSGNQGDITPPVLAFTNMATNADDVVQINVTLTEGSSTTGATTYLSGLIIGFTGSVACASLDTNPVTVTAKGAMTIQVIGAPGTYAGCSLYIRDRANLVSNLVTPGTIVIPNYAICGVVSDITKSDCKVLVDLYNSTSGSGWTNKRSWLGIDDLTPTTACDWYGVVCWGNRVSRLYLGGTENPGDWACDWGYYGGNNLSGTIPSTISNLTSLDVFCMPNNKIAGPLPGSMSGLTNLIALSLWNNPLNMTLPSSWSSMTKMQYMSLWSAGLTGTIPDSWSSMKDWLFFVNMSNNSLTGSLPSSRGLFKRISYFSFENNNLNGSLPSSWSKLPLADLKLKNNKITGYLPSSWSAMTGLKTIDLTNNNIRGFIPESWSNLTNLNNNGSTNGSYGDSNASSWIENNCLSLSPSYMSAGLGTLLTTKFNNYTTQKSCPGSIGSRVWIDTDNDGTYDNEETGTGGITVTLKSCTDQTPINTGKTLNHQLSAYYTFDAKNALDDTLNGNNGIITNTTFGAGKIGVAAIIPSNGYITHSTQGMSSIHGTIATRILPTTTSYGIWQLYDSNIANTSDWIGIFSWDASSLIFRIGDGTNGTANDMWISSTGTAPTNQRTHLAFTWSGTADGLANDTMTIYANGIIKQIKTNANLQPMMNSMARAGYAHSMGLSGSMDDFRAYGRALSASEIAQLYNVTSATIATNIPISYAGTTVASTTTASDGSYNFASVASGKYYLEYSNIPAGYKFTTQNWGGYHNSANSDTNQWSAKSSCFELYNGLNETDIDAGLIYMPYASCEAANPAYTPILLGQPVQLSIGGYGTNGQIQALSSTGIIALNQVINNQGTNWGLKTWTYNWTPVVADSYVISGAVDGQNYKLTYYNNPSLASVSCPYKVIGPGSWCAVSTTVAPYSGASITNVNQIATIPSPIEYCTAGQISSLPCSTAGDQPSAMVIKTPNTCTSTLLVTSDINVMCDAVTDVQPAECKALVSLYDSTVGSSWTTKTNWRFLGDVTPRTVCDWAGVTCAGGHVTQLIMGSNNLNGSLPLLTGLDYVTKIDLNNNVLKGSLPSGWSTTMPKLNTILLYVNQLTGTLPPSWGTNTGLVEVNLNNNSIGGGLPASWSGITNLVALYLANNPLGGSLPTSWSSLTKLQALNLSNGGYVGSLPTSWSSLTLLKNLYLNGNTLQGTIPSSWMNSLTGLNTIALYANELDGLIPSALTSLTSLIASSESSMINNCMGTSQLDTSLQLFLNSKFPSRYQTQKTCQTDLQLSLLLQTGSLFSGNSMTYSFKYYNAGSRWSYNTILGMTTDSRIGIITGSSTTGVTTTGINLGVIAPGASGAVTFVLNKNNFSGGLYSINQSWTLTDATISDTNAANHSYAVTGVQILASSSPICNHQDLTVPVLECETLMTMYNTMNGPNWTYKTGWGTNPNVGQWFGIQVDNNRVTKLALTAAGTAMGATGWWLNNNVSGAINPIVTNLTKLLWLDFIGKPGVGTLPDLGAFTELQWLRCEACNLTGSIPTGISNTKLNTVWLGDNQLNGIPSSLYTMTGVVIFSIRNNPIGGTLPTGFSTMKGLQRLELYNGGFTGSIPDVWSGMTSLQFLGLSNNSLSKEIPSSLKTLTGLRTIQFNNNQLEGIIPGWLTGLVNLQ